MSQNENTKLLTILTIPGVKLFFQSVEANKMNTNLTAIKITRQLNPKHCKYFKENLYGNQC